MADDDVFLRPARLEDLALLDRSGTPADDPFNFFGYRGGSQLRQRFNENGLLGADFGSLIVQAGEVAVGDVSWHAEAYGPPGAVSGTRRRPAGRPRWRPPYGSGPCSAR